MIHSSCDLDPSFSFSPVAAARKFKACLWLQASGVRPAGWAELSAIRSTPGAPCVDWLSPQADREQLHLSARIHGAIEPPIRGITLGSLIDSRTPRNHHDDKGNERVTPKSETSIRPHRCCFPVSSFTLWNSINIPVFPNSRFLGFFVGRTNHKRTENRHRSRLPGLHSSLNSHAHQHRHARISQDLGRVRNGGPTAD